MEEKNTWLILRRRWQGFALPVAEVKTNDWRGGGCLLIYTARGGERMPKKAVERGE